MDFYGFFGFVIILKESIKLLGKNGKLTALTTTLSMISSSIFFFIFYNWSHTLILHDMLVKESLIPISSSVVTKFISDATGITSRIPRGFVPLYSVITFLSTTATVVVSSHSCNGSVVSLKELSSAIVQSSTRAFVTAFYTTVSVVGYESLAIYLAIPLISPSLVSSNFSAVAADVVYGVAVLVLYLYISGVWIMSLVVSVIDEDGGGVAAFGKSAEIMKGQKVDAFLLNVFLDLIYFGLFLVSIVMMGALEEKIWGLLLVNLCSLVRVLTFVAYTVLYFRGKEGYGHLDEVIELQGSDVEYAKLTQLTPLVSTICNNRCCN